MSKVKFVKERVSNLNKRKIEYLIASALLVLGTLVTSVSSVFADQATEPAFKPSGAVITANNGVQFTGLGNPQMVATRPFMIKGHVIKFDNGHAIWAPAENANGQPEQYTAGQVIPESDWKDISNAIAHDVNSAENEQYYSNYSTGADVKLMWNWKVTDPNQTIPAGTTVQVPLTANLSWANQGTAMQKQLGKSIFSESPLDTNVMYNGHVVGKVMFQPGSTTGTLTFNDYFESHHLTHISGTISTGGLNGLIPNVTNKYQPYQTPTTKPSSSLKPGSSSSTVTPVKPSGSITDHPATSGSSSKVSTVMPSTSTSGPVNTDSSSDNDNSDDTYFDYNGQPDYRQSMVKMANDLGNGKVQWIVWINPNWQTMSSFNITDTLPSNAHLVGKIQTFNGVSTQSNWYDYNTGDPLYTIADLCPDTVDMPVNIKQNGNTLTFSGSNFKRTIADLPSIDQSGNVSGGFNDVENGPNAEGTFTDSTDGQTNECFQISYETELNDPSSREGQKNTIQGHVNDVGKITYGENNTSSTAGVGSTLIKPCKSAQAWITATATGIVEQVSSSSSSSTSKSSSSSSKKCSSSSVKSSSIKSSSSLKNSSSSSIKSSSKRSSSSASKKSSSSSSSSIKNSSSLKSSATIVASSNSAQTSSTKASTIVVTRPSTVTTTSYESSYINVPSTVVTRPSSVKVGSSSWSLISGQTSIMSVSSEVVKPVTQTSVVNTSSTIVVHPSTQTSSTQAEKTTTTTSSVGQLLSRETSSSTCLSTRSSKSSSIKSSSSIMSKAEQGSSTMNSSSPLTGGKTEASPREAQSLQNKAINHMLNAAGHQAGLPQTGESKAHVGQVIGIMLILMGCLLVVDTKRREKK